MQLPNAKRSTSANSKRPKCWSIPKKRAEDQTQSADRLRIRNRIISIVGVVALLLAVLAGIFGFQSNQNATHAQVNAARAVNAQATAKAETLIRATAQAEAEQAAALSFSRELAVQSELNLDVDPERSILLALAGLDRTHTLEAENALHKSIYSSRLRMTLQSQKGSIFDVRYSPDGKLIASAGDDGTARLWDAATGKQLLSLQHPSEVKMVLFSPDGTRLITAAGDGLVRIWDVAGGGQLLSIVVTHAMVPGYYYFSVSISADGKLLATTNADDGVVNVWDSASGAKLFTISSPDWSAIVPGVDLQPDALVFSSDGHLAISLTTFEEATGRIEIWDVAARRRVQTLTLQNDPYTPPAFSPDGKRLTSRDGTQGDVWDVASGNLLFTFSPDRTVNSVRYSADGTRLLVAGGGGVAEVFDAETGNKLLAFPGNPGRVGVVAGSPGCEEPPAASFEWCTTHIASVGDDDFIRIWDISPTGEQESLKVPGDDFALSADGTRLNTITYNHLTPQGGSAILIEQRSLLAGLDANPAPGYRSTFIQSGGGSHNFAFFPQDGILAIPFENGPIKFWDITQGGKPVYPISCCTWTEDMQLGFSSRLHPRLAIAHVDTGVAIIWDLAADKKIQTLQLVQANDPPSRGLISIVLNPDGEHLVIARNDGTVESWDATTGQKLLALLDSTTPGGGCCDKETEFSPDGKLIVVTNCAGMQVVFDAMTGKEIRRFSKRGCTAGAAFSVDDKYIVLRGPETKVFNIETGQEVLSLPIRGGLVLFSPDGTRLIAQVGSNASDPATVDVFLMQLEDLVVLAKTRITRGLTTAECRQYLHVEQCP